MIISQKTTLEQLAHIVCGHLNKNGIKAILTGGAVVSIYTKNKYQSFDLDFISMTNNKEIVIAMKELGFKKDKARYFQHPKTKYFVEFPAPPLAIGNEPIEKWATKQSNNGIFYLLTLTQCVMDRLSAFYHWSDYPSLEQAILVAKKHQVDLKKIKGWSSKEEQMKKYLEFARELK